MIIYKKRAHAKALLTKEENEKIGHPLYKTKHIQRQGIIMELAVQKIEPLPLEFTNEKVELLKNTVCKGASNDEFELFLHVCRRTRLDPFMKQIYSIPRGSQRTIQTSIDGLRLIAERTERYSPGKESVYFYGEKKELISSTSFVKKMTADGTWHDIACTAMFSEYNPGNNSFWKKMPHVMLAKCAEAAALRKAFPAEMSGLYIKEEMDQAESSIMETVTHNVRKQIPDQKADGEKIDIFFEQFSEEDHVKIGEYLDKYKIHHKKTFVQAIDDYQDKEKFLYDFTRWKKQEKNKIKD